MLQNNKRIEVSKFSNEFDNCSVDNYWLIFVHINQNRVTIKGNIVMHGIFIYGRAYNCVRDWMPKRTLREGLLFSVRDVRKTQTIHDLRMPFARLLEPERNLPTLCWNAGWLRGNERNRCPVFYNDNLS